MEKMDPGRGASNGEPLEALATGAATGAVVADDAPIAPPVDTSTV